MKQVIQTSAAPAAIGPYSQAVRAGNLLFLSGQLGVDPTSGILAETVEQQVVTALENIGAVLREACLGYENVVKTTVFMADMADFAKVNEAYSKYFSPPYPARSAVAVKTLPKNALVEIEVVVEIE